MQLRSLLARLRVARCGWSRSLIGLAICLPIVAGSQGAVSHRTSRNLLIAVNQGDRDISLIDPVQNKEIARVAEGAVTGHEVATSEDGWLAFIPIYGDSTPGKPGSDGDQIVVVDLRRRSVVHRIMFAHGVRPHCIVRNPRDGLLYVTSELDQSVTIIDPRTFGIVGEIPTGRPQSHMLALSPNGRYAYTANISTGSVSVLDLATRKLIRVIQVAAEIQRISVSEDGRWVFTADQRSPRLAVLDTHTNTVSKWIALPAIGYGSASTNDARWLLVTLPDAAKVAVVSLTDFRVSRVVDVAQGPHEIVKPPNKKDLAFVACTSADAVDRLDLNHWAVTATIPVGKISDGIGWAAESRTTRNKRRLDNKIGATPRTTSS